MVFSSLTVLVIGILVGVVIKKSLKLGIAIISLLGLLAATGYNFELSNSTKETIYRAFSQAPSVASQASSIVYILPVTSTAFLVGLAIGIWKG